MASPCSLLEQGTPISAGDLALWTESISINPYMYACMYMLLNMTVMGGSWMTLKCLLC